MPRIRVIVGANAMLLAGLQYLAAETVSAAVFTPAYDYAENYISDLGVADCGTVYSGREICSPLAGLMNAGFIVDGALFFIGSVLLATLFSGALRYVFLAAALLHGIGNVIVGLFDETTPAVGGAPSIHVVGALLAILFGNVAAILAGASALRHGRRALGAAGIALGSLGIVSLVLLGFDGVGLPEGLVERFSVYPITASEILFGVTILAVAWSRRAGRSPRVES
ncbi:putative membrane protein [Salinibacterium sp. CAN_S4]|uniref:DUF998 domain-containing protein n=1 Tax=Salinibacterium sp. CAN_S4 TaxID=2787727 RepID=UPI0018F00EA5